MKRRKPHLPLAPILTATLVFFVNLSSARAQGGIVNSGSSTAPEIDPSAVGAGLALLGGAVLVLRSRRNR